MKNHIHISVTSLIHYSTDKEQHIVSTCWQHFLDNIAHISWTDLKKSESEKIHKQIPSSIPQDGNNILHNPADEEEG